MRTFAQKQNQPQEQISLSLARLNTAIPGPQYHRHPLPYSQHTIGNQAGQRSLRTDAEGLEAGSVATASPRFGHDFSRIPAHTPAAASIQTKLAINQPGDSYEQEADRIAEQVMRMPEPQPQHDPMPRQDAALHQHLQRKPMASTITPLIQAKGSEGVTERDAMTNQIASSSGGGSPLPESSRRFMESRFGTDFSHVRIHTDDHAAQLSRDLSAKAFTVGRDIYFNARNFSPESAEGKHLLAHELTHTVQQGAVAGGQLRAQLMIQKKDGDKASTAFGEFEAVKYHELKQKSDGKEVGVEMFLKFNPGPKVDAKQIALTQAATGKIGGTSAAAADPNFGRRSATSGAGQGQFIDVLPGFPSPLYSTADKPTTGADASNLTSYPTIPSTALTPAQVTAQETASGVAGGTRTGFGKHGFRFKEAGVLKGPESAELYDAPQLGTANDSEQVFESTALAIEGTQKDTYYGSVNWGWKRDAAGKFSMIPFKAISQGVPTVNFLTAASVWNTATEDFNWGVSVATANILDPADTTKSKGSVVKGTALNWRGMQAKVGSVTYNLVTVKGGGPAGFIKSTEMAMTDVGRPTVHLPMEEVHKINTASAPMVDDPTKVPTTLIKNLPKDTRVTIAPDILLRVVALLIGMKIDPAWALITIVDGPDTGKQGWVQKTLLTREALGTH
ncbi:MAG TPA: DUF4157 domain-containing protein [Pyrinomonadaceae bacterium]|jgi:hypothetical protein|nr:DUF4157 domain-containing protein [Pyrinomonadaceae bacterium]